MTELSDIELNVLAQDLTIKGTMSLLNASRQTIYDLINSGDLAAYKLKRATRIKSESVLALRNRRITAED